MKKVLFIALALFLTLSLCACRLGENKTDPDTSAPSTMMPTVTNPTIIDPTILDPTFETNIPDTNVDDDHLMNPTEETTDETSPKIRNRIQSKN